MSKTNKGTPAPGKEFWSKRPKTFSNSKKLTHRAERTEAKKQIKEELDNE